MSTSASARGTTRAAPDDAYRALTGLDVPAHFPRFGPLPAVAAITEAPATWTEVGATRLVHMSDASRFREQLVVADGARLSYRLSGLTGLLGLLVSGGRADWRLAPYGAGTVVDWTYSFDPRPGRRPVVALVIALWWRRYMQRVMPAVVATLDRAA
jgi:hypothetical protein